MKKGIETYPDYDAQGRWKLCIRKVRGKFTLDEIVEAAREWEEDIYALVLKCLDGEWEETQGDYVELYRLSDMEKRGKWENDKADIPRCSCCSYIPEFNRHIDDYYYSDFCPNCGARMDGDSDDQT